MTRFETTLTERVSAILGDEWTVETPKGWNRIIVTHANGSSSSVGMYGEDGRRNATDEDAQRYAERLRNFLRGEIHKYTPEWADKGRAALESFPMLAASA